MERMKKLNEDEDEEPTEEERMKRFETIENQSAECTYLLTCKRQGI